MDKICDYDEAFTRREMYEETGRCLDCLANPTARCTLKLSWSIMAYGTRREVGNNVGYA